MKKIGLFFSITLLLYCLTGCSFHFNVSVASQNNDIKSIASRSAIYWSGIQTGRKIELNEGDEVQFDINLEKGTVFFVLKDEDDNDIYTLEKEAEYSGTETYTAQNDEILWLTEIGKSFKGSYKITVNSSTETEEESESITESIDLNEPNQRI